MSNTVKEFAIGVVVGAVLMGYLTHSKPTQETKATVNDTTQDTVTKHQTSTTTFKDGTVKTTTTDTKEIAKSTDKTTVDVSKTDKPNYSLGVDYLPAFNEKQDYRDSEIDFGVRLGGSNMWLDSGFDFKNKQPKIGLKVEF